MSTIVSRLLDVRPRAREKIAYNDLKVGDKVLVNYNIEDPSKRGFWYEATITSLKSKKTDVLIAEVKIGPSADLKGCKILFKDEVMKIEETKLLTERKLNMDIEPALRNTGMLLVMFFLALYFLF